MANAVNFINQYANNIQQFVNLLNTLQSQNLQMNDDPTLVTRYFNTPGARTDINATDIANAEAAMVQMLFTYNSGAPTQASFLLKVMP